MPETLAPTSSAKLLDAGEKVRVITRKPSDRSFPDQVEVVPGDLTRPETLPAALSGVDRAFMFPVFNGLDGFLEVARQADLQHVVLLSSSAVTYSSPWWIGEQHLQLEWVVAASGRRGPLWAQLIVDGAVVANRLALAEPYRELNLSDPELRLRHIGRDRIELSTNVPTKELRLSAPRTRWTDNFLDLMPGQPALISVPGLDDSPVRAQWLGTEGKVEIAVIR